jgi:hypothetical protein
MAAAALLLAACAGRPDGPERLNLEQELAERYYVMGTPVDRIRNYRLNGWNYVDNYHVIMQAGVREHYLVTLRSHCPDLSTATSIAFTTTVGSLTTSDALLVHGPGQLLDRCYIRHIDRLERIERDD